MAFAVLLMMGSVSTTMHINSGYSFSIHNYKAEAQDNDGFFKPKQLQGKETPCSYTYTRKWFRNNYYFIDCHGCTHQNAYATHDNEKC